MPSPPRIVKAGFPRYRAGTESKFVVARTLRRLLSGISEMEQVLVDTPKRRTRCRKEKGSRWKRGARSGMRQGGGGSLFKQRQDGVARERTA